MKPFRSSRRSLDPEADRRQWLFGTRWLEGFRAQDESANTIEHLLRRYTVAVDEIKPLMSALRSETQKLHEGD